MLEKRSLLDVLRNPLTDEEMAGRVYFETVTELYTYAAKDVSRAAGIAVAEAIEKWYDDHGYSEGRHFGTEVSEAIAEAKEGVE